MATTMAVPIPEQYDLIAAFDRLFCSDLDPFDPHPSVATEEAFFAFVSAFNRLPRVQTTPFAQHENHWHFSLRTINRRLPDTILFMVCPSERFVHIEHPPLSIDLEHESLETRARVSAILLLRAFAGEELGRSRPWSLSTDCQEMLRSVEMVLRELGVRERLDMVHISNRMAMRIVREEWMKFYEALLRLSNASEQTIVFQMVIQRRLFRPPW